MPEFPPHLAQCVPVHHQVATAVVGLQAHQGAGVGEQTQNAGAHPVAPKHGFHWWRHQSAGSKRLLDFAGHAPFIGREARQRIEAGLAQDRSVVAQFAPRLEFIHGML